MSSVGSLEGWTLDAVVTSLSLLMMAGVALDFRVHTAGISFEEEGFFTPEHVFFYSMFLGIGAVIAAATYQGWRRTGSLRSAVPSGYVAGLAGVALFGFGGGGDFVWHTLFGFETGVEALTSPSHLALATGAVLFFASPLRATMRREGQPSSALGFAPALVSASLVLTIIVFFTAYINPVMDPMAYRNEGAARTLGVVGLFLFPTVLVGGALVLVRRFDLPAGALTFTFFVPVFASTIVNDIFALVLPAIAAGLVGDAINRYRRPTTADPLALRAFGALVPATFALGYFAVIELTGGIAWTVHIWTGAVALAAMAGLLLTYVLVPDGTRAIAER